MAGDSVAGLVLAAGLGRRFGGAKLAAELEGRPMLAHVLDTARRAADEGTLAGPLVVVVPGGPDEPAEAGALRRLAGKHGWAVVTNDHPATGLARSLRLGLAALEGTAAGAALVILGDQPRTSLAVIRALAGEWRRSRTPMLVPRYGGRPGNPVLVAREAWPLARRLRGDTGMRAIARRQPELVTYLDVPGDNPDVDRPTDLEALEALAGPGG